MQVLSSSDIPLILNQYQFKSEANNLDNFYEAVLEGMSIDLAQFNGM